MVAWASVDSATDKLMSRPTIWIQEQMPKLCLGHICYLFPFPPTSRPSVRSSDFALTSLSPFVFVLVLCSHCDPRSVSVVFVPLCWRVSVIFVSSLLHVCARPLSLVIVP